MNDNEKIYGTMFVLFFLAVGMVWFKPNIDNLISGFVIKPIPGGEPGLAQPGETISVDLSVKPTKSYTADMDPLDPLGKVLLLKKQVTVKRIGETIARYDDTTDLLSTSTSIEIPAHVDYTVPANEPVGAFLITLRIYAIPGTYYPSLGKVVYNQLGIEDLGYQQAAFYVKTACVGCLDEATLRQILQDLLDQLICSICGCPIITNPYCIPK